MKKIADGVRRVLYNILPLKFYLLILSKVYFVSFRLGLLKGIKNYEYPYFMKNVIQKGDVCIDIGANLGYLSILFSDLVGEKGKVYSVEPVKPILEILKINKGKRKNIEILPFALGEDNKQIKLGNDTIDKSGYMQSGSNTIVSDDESDSDISFDATMKKGSEVFSHLTHLQFVKCDIEGYEWTVLTELEPVIMKHRPMLLIETGGNNRKKLLEYFKKHNFDSFILNDGQLIPATDDNYWDILTVPKEKLSTLSRFM